MSARAPKGQATKPSGVEQQLVRQLEDARQRLEIAEKWNRDYDMRHRAIDDILKGQEITLNAMRRLLRSSGHLTPLPPMEARYAASVPVAFDDDMPF